MQQLAFIPLIQDIVALQNSFLASKSMSQRKRLGQFFTRATVSEYMASLVRKPKSKSVRILDAGAGAGILTASLVFRCFDLGCKTVHAVLYEVDRDVVPSLEQTLTIIQTALKRQSAIFTYEIRCEDFVLARPDKDESLQGFDIAVINPPYFKYSAKDSPYATATLDLYQGNPNIYASFMAVVMAAMKEQGQMISITPRSFTNGLYFKGFRSYLLTESALDLIHIFKYRDKVFQDDNSSVLQENVICRFVKHSESNAVVVRSSDCDTSINNADERRYPFDLMVDTSNDQRIIRIPESANQARILRQVEALPTTFEGAGYFISTGRVVEHRARDYITEEHNMPKTAPLYRPHNVTPLTATWTGSHKKEVSLVLRKGHEKHTMKDGTFVLLKRFSSKDEKRRLVAGVHLEGTHDCELIGFGNKTNYIGVNGETLTAVEAYGLAAIFNSSVMEKYFRCMSGNTQVNATEIRVMKFPTRKQVRDIGKRLQNIQAGETREIDMIVNRVLGLIDLIR